MRPNLRAIALFNRELQVQVVRVNGDTLAHRLDEAHAAKEMQGHQHHLAAKPRLLLRHRVRMAGADTHKACAEMIKRHRLIQRLARTNDNLEGGLGRPMPHLQRMLPEFAIVNLAPNWIGPPTTPRVN